MPYDVTLKLGRHTGLRNYSPGLRDAVLRHYGIDPANAPMWQPGDPKSPTAKPPTSDRGDQ